MAFAPSWRESLLFANSRSESAKEFVSYFYLWKSPGIINPAIISLAFSQRLEYKKKQTKKIDQAFIYSVMLMKNIFYFIHL